MSMIRINFKEGFNPCNRIYIANKEESLPFQLALPKDGISDFEYIDKDGNSTPMILIPEKEFDNLLNQTNLERIHCLLEKLSLLYESISNKEIAFDIACGKPSYDSQRAASDRVDKFQNVVVQIYDVLYNKE